MSKLVSPRLRGTARRGGFGLPAGLAGGLAAGCAAFCFDWTLELLTRGEQALGPQGEVAVVYLSLGALAGLLATLGSYLAGRAPHSLAGIVQIAAWALFLPYLIPAWERLASLVGDFSATLALPALLIAVPAALGTWLVILRQVSGPGSWTRAAVLAALTMSLLLAVNRNLLADPLTPKALASDVAVLLGVLLLALAVRRWTPTRVAVVMLSGLAVATFGVWMSIWINRGAAASFDPKLDFATGRPPHVVLLTIDTLRHDVFQEFAHSTPEGRRFLQALAGATFFEQAHAPSPWTAPSVATLMTGLLPDEHGYGVRTGDPNRPLAGLALDIPTLAEGLRDAGYRTEAFVANPLLFPGSGIDRGFHSYQALEDTGRRLPWMRLFAIPKVRKITRRWIRQLPYVPAERVADLLERRIRAIDDADSTPYFLWVHLMDPHAPYVRRHVSPVPKGEPDRSEDSKNARYGGEVRYALRHAARILEALQTQGLLANAVTIFTSDHGEMFPQDLHREHRRGQGGPARIAGHGHSLHAEVVRVPLAIRGPHAKVPDAPVKHRLLSGPRRVPVSLVDLPATLEDLLRLPLGLRRSASALSLADWVVSEESETQAAPPRHDRAITLSGNEWGPPQRGLVQGRWKLIHFPGGEAGDRLYELRRDLRERGNAAQHRPALVRALRRRLDEEWGRMKTAPTSGPAAEAQEIDEETRQRLKALGYLD